LNNEIHHLLFKDGSMIRDYQAIQKTWLFFAENSASSRRRESIAVKLLASVDYVTGRIIWQEDEKYTPETFLSLLPKEISAYPTGKD